MSGIMEIRRKRASRSDDDDDDPPSGGHNTRALSFAAGREPRATRAREGTDRARGGARRGVGGRARGYSKILSPLVCVNTPRLER